MTIEKFKVSKDTPALFITAVAKDRLPVFQINAVKALACAAINDARHSCDFLLFAYVIMPDHMHVLTNSPRKPSEVLRFIKGNISRRVINYLKESNYQSSLQKLERESGKRNHQYSLWAHDSNVFSVFSESILMQKVNYIHLNPVREGLAERVIDYRWSSVRYWQRCEKDDEPLSVDLDHVEWRKAGS